MHRGFRTDFEAGVRRLVSEDAPTSKNRGLAGSILALAHSWLGERNQSLVPSSVSRSRPT
jgi:hypothetical protein